MADTGDNESTRSDYEDPENTDLDTQHHEPVEVEGLVPTHDNVHLKPLSNREKYGLTTFIQGAAAMNELGSTALPAEAPIVPPAGSSFTRRLPIVPGDETDSPIVQHRIVVPIDTEEKELSRTYGQKGSTETESQAVVSDDVLAELDELLEGGPEMLEALGKTQKRLMGIDIEVTPYVQLKFRAAAMYYQDLAPRPLSRVALMVIYRQGKSHYGGRVEPATEAVKRTTEALIEGRILFWASRLSVYLYSTAELFSDSGIAVVAEKEIFKRITELREKFPDGHSIYQLINHIAEVGKTCVVPVPRFLQDSPELEAYMIAVCKGKRTVSHLEMKVTPRPLVALTPGLKEQLASKSQTETKKGDTSRAAEAIDSTLLSPAFGPVDQDTPRPEGSEEGRNSDSDRLRNLGKSQHPFTVRNTHQYAAVSMDHNILYTRQEEILKELQGLRGEVVVVKRAIDSQTAMMTKLSEAFSTMISRQSYSDLAHQTNVNQTLLRNLSPEMQALKTPTQKATLSDLASSSMTPMRPPLPSRAKAIINLIQTATGRAVDGAVTTVRQFFEEIGEKALADSVSASSIIKDGGKARLIKAIQDRSAVIASKMPQESFWEGVV